MEKHMFALSALLCFLQLPHIVSKEAKTQKLTEREEVLLYLSSPLHINQYQFYIFLTDR